MSSKCSLMLWVMISPLVNTIPLNDQVDLAESYPPNHRTKRQFDLDLSFLDTVDGWIENIRRYDRQNCLQRMLCERMAFRNIETPPPVSNELELELEPDPNEDAVVIEAGEEIPKEPRREHRTLRLPNLRGPLDYIMGFFRRPKRQFGLDLSAFNTKSVLTLVDAFLGSTSLSSYGLTHAAYMGSTFDDPTNCFRLYGTCPDNLVRVLHRFTGGPRNERQHRSGRR